jgi:hypothetical protein
LPRQKKAVAPEVLAMWQAKAAANQRLKQNQAIGLRFPDTVENLQAIVARSNVPVRYIPSKQEEPALEPVIPVMVKKGSDSPWLSELKSEQERCLEPALRASRSDHKPRKSRAKQLKKKVLADVEMETVPADLMATLTAELVG